MLKTDKVLYGIRDGIADVGDVAVGFFAAELPLQDVTGLLFQSQSTWAMLKTTQQLAKEFPEFRAEPERNNLKVLAYTGGAVNALMTTKPVRKLEDLKGMKIRTFGITSWFSKGIGATPLSMPAMDTHVALQKGTVAGISA